MQAENYILFSLYYDANIRNKALDILKNVRRFKSIPEIEDVDIILLTKHASQAELLSRPNYLMLSCLFVITIIGLLIVDEPMKAAIAALAIIITTTYLVYKEYNFRTFIRTNIRNKPISEWPLVKYDEALVANIEKYRSPCIRYFKGFDPFALDGYLLDAWSLPVDIVKPNDNTHPVLSFETHDLYAYLLKDLVNLKLGSITEKDLIYVSLDNINKNDLFYSNGNLINAMDEGLLETFRNLKPNDFRLYKSYKFKDWEDQFVLVLFVRLYKTPENLYIETKFYLAPPTISKEIKKLVDNNLKNKRIKLWSRFLNHLGLIQEKIFLSPFALLLSISNLIQETFFESQKEIKQRNQNDDSNLEYLGVCPNIGHIFRSAYYENYYQLQDKEYYLKVAEKRILNSIIQFLKRYNVDTSDFEDTKTHILNNGIMMTGGNVNADNISVGSKNRLQSTTSKIKVNGDK
jgi:hypothetical protein